MSSSNRYQVAPTVTVLTAMKTRLVGATKGHALVRGGHAVSPKAQVAGNRHGHL